MPCAVWPLWPLWPLAVSVAFLLGLVPGACSFDLEFLEPLDFEGCHDQLPNCPQLRELSLGFSGGRCRYPAAELCLRSCGLCGRVRRARRCEVQSCRPFCEDVDWPSFLGKAVEKAKGQGMQAKIVSTSPVLAEFADFFTAKEVETLTEVAFQAGFQMEDELPKAVRDVHKIDCEDPGCLLDPMVQEVYRRVSELLGIPPENFESMEFLLYERGQHYKAHMDDELEDLRHAPGPSLSAGLRVLTVFFYLSESEGGETTFPKKGLVIKPAAGKAVIWANVKSDLWRTDPNSLHRAMPVVSGRKLAANFWVHPFEYRASERYCRS